MQNLIDQYRTWNNRRVAAKQLNALPDRMLRDIGIERSQIEFAVAGKVDMEPVGSYNRYAMQAVSSTTPLVTMRALSVS